MTKVLLVGETWVTSETHFKGFDNFGSAGLVSGAGPLLEALAGTGVEVEHLGAHDAPERFPFEATALGGYDVVVLSDVGANSLLLHPDTWQRGRKRPNRLRMLADWVRDGGGLAMAGGYLSFQGIEGKAGYRRTAIEEVLPVTIDPWDDRVEVPEGFAPELTGVEHPVIAGIAGAWPELLGYNRVTARDDATVLAVRGEDPLLAVRGVGAGRSLAWTSDIGPHWCPHEFLSWDGYARLWAQAFAWLAGQGGSAPSTSPSADASRLR
jgi:uncharacterized membrane protein